MPHSTILEEEFIEINTLAKIMLPKYVVGELVSGNYWDAMMTNGFSLPANVDAYT